jgi:hypothetical protein
VVWKVDASVRTTAFLSVQGSDHDHQTNQRGVTRGILRDRKRIERASGCAQTLAVSQYTCVA